MNVINENLYINKRRIISSKNHYYDCRWLTSSIASTKCCAVCDARLILHAFLLAAIAAGIIIILIMPSLKKPAYDTPV